MFKFIFCILCLLFMIICPIYIFNVKGYEINLNEFFNLSNSSKTILTVYHIETFEGGTNSRSKYLERQASLFNKKYPNCFVVVKTLTPDELALNLRKNELPDLYSFGVGVGSYIAGFLEELEGNSNIRKDLTGYGERQRKLLAYPYILSGYCLISHENLISGLESSDISNYTLSTKYNNKEVKGLSIATKSLINPVLALRKNNINYNIVDLVEFNSTYDAYNNFIAKKSVSLIGTARDLARCKNREVNGSLSSCKYTFLGGFSDLVQYIGVVDSGSDAKEHYAKLFANFLLTDNAQSTLSRYGLFSVNGKNIYESGYMFEFESILNKDLTSVNAFISKEEINKLQQENL